ARSFRISQSAELIEQFFDDHRDPPYVGIARSWHRVKINPPLIGGLDVIAARVPWMKLHRGHLYRPDHIRRMGNAQLVCVSIETRKMDPYCLDPRRPSIWRGLLVPLLSPPPIGK